MMRTEKQIEAKRVYNREWKKKNKDRPSVVRTRTLCNWRTRKVKGDLKTFYDEKYINATHCEVCEKVFKCRRDRCMDHDHSTGNIRQIICFSCNAQDRWMDIIIPYKM